MSPRKSKGAPVALITPKFLRAMPLPDASAAGDKEGRGRVLVVGGARQMPGAILLAGVATLRAGAGKLQIATARSVAAMVGIEIPEALVLPLPETQNGAIHRTSAKVIGRAADVNALLVGPGMMDAREVESLLLKLIPKLAEKDLTLILDAEPLALLAKHPSLLRPLRGRVVVTPHAGEMAKMCNLSKEEVQRSALSCARKASREWGVVVALKGADTFVCAPNGDAAHNQAGNAGLATSGSGDTLAGVVAGLAARGARPFEAAVWGVHLHARAGDALAKRIAPIGYLARELLDEIPRQMRVLEARA